MVRSAECFIGRALAFFPSARCAQHCVSARERELTIVFFFLPSSVLSLLRCFSVNSVYSTGGEKYENLGKKYIGICSG